MEPTILVFDHHDTPPARWEARLPAEVSRSITTDWRDFALALPASGCALVAIDDWSDSERVGELALLQRDHGGIPLVIMTDPDPHNLLNLKALVIEEILWSTASDHTIRSTLKETLQRARRTRILEVFPNTATPALERAAEIAVEADPPFRTVAEWCEEVGMNRRTLWRHWKAAFGDHPPMTPKQFLSWLICIEATCRKRPGRCWAGVARNVGVHIDTLRRTTRRTVGRSLGELALIDPSNPLRSLVRTLDPPLRDPNDA